MKTAVIMTDAAGYPNRAEILSRTMNAAGIPFLRVSPVEQPQLGASPIDLPPEWLPAAEDRPDHWKHWYRNHLHCLAAVRRYGIQADHVWCAEGDVSASPATWLRLLETTADMPHDGLWTRLYHRSDGLDNGWFGHPTTPEWADWYCLGALFRVSARALDWWEQAAAETREVFTEIAAPSIIAREGGTIGRINRPDHPPLYHCGTMKFNPSRTPPIHHPQMFCHPCKFDDPLTPAPAP
jgi:hypothetical protein